MPRRTKPRFAIDLVQEIQPCPLSKSDLRNILLALPPFQMDRSEACIRLQRCAATYLWVKRQYKAHPTTAERNAYLAKLEKSARETCRMLERMDLDTLFRFASHTTYRIPSEALDDLKDQLELVADIANNLVRSGKARSGPRLEIPIHRAVQLSAILWAELTGQPFTHNPKELTDYKGDPRSPAGRFVMTFFKAVDSGVAATTIAGAMASVVKDLRRSKS